MAVETTERQCYGDKIREQHIPRPSKAATDSVDSVHSRTFSSDKQERYERVKISTPDGFHELLQKIVRSVILSRPAHVYRFIAEMLETELTQRTFNDIALRCALKKSRKLEARPSESCRLFNSFLEQTKVQIFGPDQFTMGPIPDYERDRPALDRYRDYAGIGVFDMTCCELPPEPQPCDTAELQQPPECVEPAGAPVSPAHVELTFDKGPIPEYELQEPAIDRYREYAGIESFDLVAEPCEDHALLCR